MQTIARFPRAQLAIAMAALVFFAGHSSSALAAPAPGTVDLVITPPDLTTSVDPNIMLSFDDSGSMARRYMGDNRPFDGAGWGAPFACAGVIDPRITNPGDIRSQPMNGVYFNPNILYLPPVRADGSPFPNADASLAAVWADGIAINRPANAVTPAGAADNNNIDSAASGSDNRVTYINGVRTTGYNGYDRRWTCGWGSYPTSFVGGENVNSGGPYYYRYKSSAPTIAVDSFGKPTAAGRAVLYDSANWEAVAVSNTAVTIDGVTVNQWQNFANWYAYYRTRNLMARTALSRVFAQFGSNIRVAWQTIGCPSGATEWGCASFIDNYPGASVITASTIISNLVNGKAGALTYRDDFFNFLFSVPASINTPNRRATVRAGEFFKRPASSDLKNPYWQPADPVTGTVGRELSCRQNFHMLVTDGYWNEANPSVSSFPTPLLSTSANLAFVDGTTYSNSAAVSRVFWDVVGGSYATSLANIAYTYWANDLRPDLTNNVPAYFPDKTTGITGATALPPGADPKTNAEIYFNPVNDPATWQHVVQFMVTLGVNGNLYYSDDGNCADPDNDFCKLRKGQGNSTGLTGWPTPANNSPPGIDDTWHAAVNSRGSYFSAGNPSQLVAHLTQIIASVLVRSSNSTAAVTSLPFQTIGNAAFGGSYDSSDWSGRLLRMIPYDATGHEIVPPTVKWDAGCTLTGGNCIDGTKPGAVPGARVVLTSDGSSTGLAFRWASLTSAQQSILNANPLRIAASANPASWLVGPDNFGSKRVDYLRGDRTYETPGSPSDPQFRRRGSLLGAIVNSQPLYNASAASGWFDVFPAGSPEANVVGTSGDYQHFVDSNKTRPATVYVGANDGMLHAFNAVTGDERWAFVPNTLFANGNLARMTDKARGLIAGVDSQPTVQDVFIGGQWRTVLVSSLRLGGRGLFALDVTNPASVSEGTPSNTVMWEFSNGATASSSSDPACSTGTRTCPSLGYTFGRPNIVRLANGKWAVLVSSGYFPNGPVADSYDDPASTEAAASRTSLLVIDLESGTLIREIKTSTAPQFAGVTTYGLSQPGVYDMGGDQVDDIAVAGDLAGNLWRFDLSDSNPANWKVDLMFKSYPSTADNTVTGKCDAVGKCPITVMPVGMRNPAIRGVVWIFGTGKYLGKSDRANNIPAQSFYGIYDYGTASSSYPILPSQLNKQHMVEETNGSGTTERFISSSPVASVSNPKGWTLPLDIAAEAGERNVVTGSALDTNNWIVLATLIPTTSDPCTPGRKGSIFVVRAESGSGIVTGVGASSGYPTYVRSGVVDTSGSIPSSGDSLPITSAIGGGMLNVLGIKELNVPDNYWYRTAWRRLLDTL